MKISNRTTSLWKQAVASLRTRQQYHYGHLLRQPFPLACSLRTTLPLLKRRFRCQFFVINMGRVTVSFIVITQGRERSVLSS